MLAPQVLMPVYCETERVTRVRGEQGGTTGVLDGEVDEERGEREKEGETRSHMHRHGRAQKTQQTLDDRKTEYTNANVCIYIDIKKVTANRPTQQIPTPAHSHAHTNRAVRWRLCRKHTGVPRSRVSLPKTCARKRLWRKSRREGSVPVRQHFVLTNARSPLPCSPSLL